MRVFLSNLGCKLNQAELDGMARAFRARGHHVVADLAGADLHVVNTCTVTRAAARDSRKLVRRGLRQAGLRTVVTGCWVEDPEADRMLLGEVDLVVPNRDKEGLVERVVNAFPELAVRNEGPLQAVPVSYVPLEVGRTRALVKVEDGCNMACAFCIIPQTRGRQRSRPLVEVVDEVRRLESAGYREIVVTGVQISSYRDGAARLPDLVSRLLEETTGCRLRLTSIAPWDFADGLVPLFAHPRLCRHVHLSLQSGSDAVLARMRRPYTTADFSTLVGRLRESVPGIAVTTDVIVGFPGESAAEFARSLDFVEKTGFSRVHAFSYSARPGTAAAEHGDDVSAEERRVRMRSMLAAAQRGAADFARQHDGVEAEVLWEEQRAGVWRGMTDNYLRVSSRSVSAKNLRGSFTRATLRAGREGLWADAA